MFNKEINLSKLWNIHMMRYYEPLNTVFVNSK